MSVNFRSAVMYGYNTENLNITFEQMEILQDHGFDTVYDPYQGEVKMVGVILSRADDDSETKSIELNSDIIAKTTQKFKGLVHSLSTSYKELLVPAAPTINLYHTCWAE